MWWNFEGLTKCPYKQLTKERCKNILYQNLNKVSSLFFFFFLRKPKLVYMQLLMQRKKDLAAMGFLTRLGVQLLHLLFLAVWTLKQPV